MRKTVRLGDRQIAYREAGAGAPLVLLHAFPLDADLWEPQLSSVPDGWRLIAPDFRGFGGSHGPEVETLDDYARDVLELLDALAVGPAVMGGLSMGGYTLFRLLGHAPARVRGLLLADTRAQADTEEGRANRRRMQAIARTDGAAAIAAEMLPKLVSDTTRAARPEIVTQVDRLIRAARPDAIVAALGAMMRRPDATPLLGSIACPTLIVVGSDDRLTPVADSELMQRGIPGATLRVIPGAGHLSSLEASETFGAALEGFLEGVTRT